MRILFLTSAYNSLSQLAHLELTERGHLVSVELALSDTAMTEAVDLFQPDLIVAPMLKRAIPEAIWRSRTCLIVHPGVKGDRGPSSLDWAIQQAQELWGVTILAANEDMDAGDIWASEVIHIPKLTVSKSTLYRTRITEAALRALITAVERVERGDFVPEALDYARTGVWGTNRPIMTQAHRAIDWSKMTTSSVARRIRAADSFPGVADTVLGDEYLLFGAHEEDRLKGPPGELLATRNGAICRGTVDGAIWITHLRRRHSNAIKLPAVVALGEKASGVPESLLAVDAALDHQTYREIQYVERGPVGVLSFEFYNGAMGTEQCRRLTAAFAFARSRPTRVIVLAGGRDFFSNGIHLNLIEHAADPAQESWDNINAIDDLVHAILDTPSHLVVSALRGNAGAGGVMLALAADHVWARAHTVLNPHYALMGLHGSEYWTYLLPKRVGEAAAAELTESCLPISSAGAVLIGLIDAVFGDDLAQFEEMVEPRAAALATSGSYDTWLREKAARRAHDEAIKPLAAYRTEELARMWENFFGADRSYHEARRRFVRREPPIVTPAHLALHRRDIETRATGTGRSELTPQE
jgi:putative two-component system hydrogenase maturation factor HypX/HoxX